MANANAPYGLLLIDSEGTQFRVRRYPKKSGNAIYDGDPVIQASTGDVDVAAAGGALLGVAQEYKAASDTSDIAVCDDPNATFSVQASSLVAAADVNLNADIVYTAGDATIKRSKVALDQAAMDTTATRQLKIIGPTTDIGNAFGSFVHLKVKINNHVFKGGTGTAGV